MPRCQILSSSSRKWRGATGLSIALALVLPHLVLADSPSHCRYSVFATVPLTYRGAVPTVESMVDGVPMTMLVDTGAQMSGLTLTEATKRGLPVRASDAHFYGVSGQTTASLVHLDDIAIGAAHSRDVDFWVIDDVGGGGVPFGGLIGADFIFRSDVEFSPAERQMRLFLSQDCDKTFLAYWDRNASMVPLERTQLAADGRWSVPVEVNGKTILALIDSGANRSFIDLAAAAEAGVTPDSPGVVPGESSFGIGTHKMATWVASFDTIRIGDESIGQARIQMGKLLGAVRRDRNDERTAELIDDHPKMLLGADFLRAHRVLFAVGQKRLYFSYLGGKVFDTGAAPPNQPP